MVPMTKYFLQKGDTLTEVMFATAVAALVIVISMTAMNRSFAQTQMAVETTFVRQAMDGEAELLRYARDQYIADQTGDGGKLWRDIIAQADATASDFGTCFNSDPTQPIDLPVGSFFIKDDDLNNIQVDSNQTNFTRPDTFATLGNGVWVEAVKGFDNSNGITYLDLHIRACWDPPFNSSKSTLGTIVRLHYVQ